MQCQQLLLRHQIANLTALWDLPPEYEIVCRDIWGIHLSQLTTPIPAEPYHFEHGEFTQNTAELSISADDGKLFSIGDAEPSEDSDVLELLRENSETESSDDEERDFNQGRSEGFSQGSRPQSRSQYCSPMNNIGILVLACWILRIPIMYGDFLRSVMLSISFSTILTHLYSVIESYDLPYLEPMRYIPSSMACHLSKSSRVMLCPQVSFYELLRCLHHNFSATNRSHRLFSGFTGSHHDWQHVCISSAESSVRN